MKSQNSDFWHHRKVRNVERRILNTINVYNGAKISAKICKILQKCFLHTYFRSTVYVDGIQNSPLDVSHLPMKKKMAFLRIHFLHLSLTSQEKVSLINLGFRWEKEKNCPCQNYLKLDSKVWKPRFSSPPPLGGKNHATSYHLINCLLGRPTESGVSIP